MNLSEVSIPLERHNMERLSWKSWGVDTHLFSEFITGVSSIGEETVSQSLFGK